MLYAAECDITSNARMKSYPVCSVLQVANAPIFRERGWEPKKRLYDVPPKGNAKNAARSLEVSRARARGAVRDIALCNPFTHFFTWTLNAQLVDRYDDDAVKKKLENTLRNLVRRRGFRYVCIPERHKDGALHFHGLCIPASVRLERAVDPFHRKPKSTNNGQPIYNMTDWPWGFSTCIPIDENYARTVNYLLKYMTKGHEKIFGKWYLSARDLRKEPDIFLIDGVDFDSFIADNPDAAVVPLYRDVRMGIKQLDATLSLGGTAGE